MTDRLWPFRKGRVNPARTTGEQHRPTPVKDKADYVFTECTHALASRLDCPVGLETANTGNPGYKRWPGQSHFPDRFLAEHRPGDRILESCERPGSPTPEVM